MGQRRSQDFRDLLGALQGFRIPSETDRAHEETLEELSCHGDSTPVSLSYVSAIARTREKKLTVVSSVSPYQEQQRDTVLPRQKNDGRVLSTQPAGDDRPSQGILNYGNGQ